MIPYSWLQSGLGVNMRPSRLIRHSFCSASPYWIRVAWKFGKLWNDWPLSFNGNPGLIKELFWCSSHHVQVPYYWSISLGIRWLRTLYRLFMWRVERLALRLPNTRNGVLAAACMGWLSIHEYRPLLYASDADGFHIETAPTFRRVPCHTYRSHR